MWKSLVRWEMVIKVVALVVQLKKFHEMLVEKLNGTLRFYFIKFL